MSLCIRTSVACTRQVNLTEEKDDQGDI
jgi:hypothetical protein